ncbi:MAG: ABC transporter permease [Actinomycetota bacterium]|jgi:peptide/nickel transport system permease protein|nr:ABC transporter permease [Actinomycetota bacterium]
MTVVVVEAAGARSRAGLWRWARNPSAVVGGTLVGLVVLTALVSLVWTPYPPLAVDPSHTLARPSWAHLFGTDEYGRDVLSRVMAGSRISLYAGVVSVLVATAVGVPAGLLAAERGGIPAQVVLRLSDILYAFPALLAAITLSAALGASTTTAMLAIGIAFIPVFVRVTRSNALVVLGSDYVLAARAYGRRPLAILRRHVLPNIATTVIAQMSLLFSLAILAEAGLDYLGLGTTPPTASWGNMIETGQTYLSQDPLLSVWPGIAIFVAVLGFTLLGEGIAELRNARLGRSA